MDIIDVEEVEKNNELNKLIIVGNEYSEYKRISDFIEQNGIAPASIPNENQLSAQEISGTILKSLKITTLQSKSLKVPKVWDGLLMNFYMQNIDNGIWFWEDPNALSLLEYYKSLDDQLSFVLVYNDPKSAILKYLETHERIKLDALDTLLKDWLEYNHELLQFFYKNKDKAILVNSSEFGRINSKHLVQFSKKIGLSLSSKKIASTLKSNSAMVSTNKRKRSSPLFDFMIESLHDEYPEVTALYDEMQSVANIYSTQHHDKKVKRKKAFCEMINLQKHHENLLMKQNTLYQEKNAFLTQLDEQKKESALLLEQLHTVQEELEKNYNDTVSLKDKSLEYQNKKALLDKEKKELENKILILEKEKEEKKKTLEENKAILENKVKSLEEAIKKEKAQKEENHLLLEQLHTVQEELEKYYVENKALKEEKEQVKRYYGAGERLKNEFTYSLGREIMKKVKSPLGLLSLPFFVLTIRSKYKKDLKNSDEKLPPIETYADAYEAQRAKQHLTYMLGETSIKVMSNPLGLFVLPFKLKQTHNRFKKNRKG